MNEFITLFNGPLAEQIGWTLINSLWQGLIIAAITLALLRVVPTKYSNVRYSISGIALLLIFASAAATFGYLNSTAQPTSPQSGTYLLMYQPTNVEAGQLTVIEYIRHFVSSNKSLIVLVWIIGAIGFMIRLLGGWLYTNTLRASSTLLNNEWSAQLRLISERMGIRKMVMLAESAALDAPVVIGYLKPLIIVPVGMLSGLTAEEVETIMLHELMHIKRNDYIINILQSFIESILFFNPFVWILSAIIRREREHCCDDGVIAHHGNAMAYAYALTRLEEIRLAGPSLALSAVGNRYELLNRIKRIMEKSVKKYSGTDRIVPLVLLVAGIILASFLTIGATNEPREVAVVADKHGKLPVAIDTPEKKKEASFYRKSETVVDENGEPHEIITEEYTGDSDLFPMMDFTFDSSLYVNFPQGFDMDLAFDAMPPMPMMLDFDPMLNLDIVRSLPPGFPNTFWQELDPSDTTRFKNWAQFNREFQKKFSERFKSFFDENQDEFEEMMKEMESKFKDMEWELRHQHIADEKQRHTEHLQKELDEMQQIHGREVSERQHEVQARLEAEMKRVEEQMHRVNEEMAAMDKNMKAFEKELKEELVKDGYLKKGETLKTVNWNEEGEFIINGKKIKSADMQKYEKLREKYFKGKFRTFHLNN